MTPSTDDYASLRKNVSHLGRLLGDTIAAAEGAPFLELIESIRKLSRAARANDTDAQTELLTLLRGLSDAELIPVARAFSQFLNLANIAEERHAVSREMDASYSARSTLESTLDRLADAGVAAQGVDRCIAELNIELVLTAHPTEITRRTLIHKHRRIAACLAELELSGHTEEERQLLEQRLRELIAQIWYGEDFRRNKPTPVDEATWGFAVVEEALWHAVPDFLRRLNRTLAGNGQAELPIDAAPVRFASWMGGDRDGNPNVTAEVSQRVLLLARWKAADLYLRDVGELLEELSMVDASDELRALTGDAPEPYRVVLRTLRQLLRDSLKQLERALDDASAVPSLALQRVEQILEPLELCHRSLIDCGMATIANGALLDLLRRVRCFGIHLLRLDLRQDSARHSAALGDITRWLGIGDFEQWNESERQRFLLRELANRRPLLPPNWRGDDDTNEVLATCRVVAQTPPAALGAYVISMAHHASDVLAVLLLLKESGCTHKLPIAPLFETLDDLERAASAMTELFELAWYREYCKNFQMVMIGYSDSAKDAGMLAAAWAQYRAQESLLALGTEHGIEVRLFHGRGGTIGRGGLPARDALLSQPPGSLRSGLRVTEQGETIRAKFGSTAIATKTLALYASAILEANLITPRAPEPEWRTTMDALAAAACGHYRSWIRDDERFVDYFRQATPEQELATLPLGSRPARRRGSGGIESLRAIPWIFAWSQNRLMLPAWLGAGRALAEAEHDGRRATLQDMVTAWPLFATRLSMLEMVFAKADAELSAYYDDQLVEPELQPIGQQLREQLAEDQRTVLRLLGKDALLEGQDWLRTTIQLRNVYTDPLNILQAELLQRQRLKEEHGAPNDLLAQAIMVTIAGVAAGMRNTG
ncbi:MAG: phosphoenolpyruvate carboxylase [Pseudomonadota bacterium]